MTTLPLAARLARRDLRGGLRGFRIFLACLALGVAAIAAVGLVRTALQEGLAREGARLLGGDAEAELTYRFASDAERAFMAEKALRVSEAVDFRSLATVGDDRALTQVRAVDDAYPLVGTVELDPAMPLAQAFAGTRGLPGAVMERVLADRLGLAPGDSFRLGTQDFVLSAVLRSYPDNASAGFSLGPRTLLLTRDLAGSGLITEGTLFSTLYRLDLPEGADLDALAARADSLFRDSGLRWRDSRRGAGGTAEFVDRLGSFLVLVGLSGLAVGGVGIFAAVRAYLAAKTATIATLRTLGATRATVFATYAIQIGVIAALGIALGLALGAALPLLAAPLLAAALPLPADFALYPAPLAEAALYGALAAALFSLWPLARTEDIRPAALLRDALSSARALPAPRYLLLTLALLALLVGAAILFSGAWQLTLATTGGIAAALALLGLAAMAARRLARRLAHLARGRPALRLALGAIGSRDGETTSVVLSLGLGLAVLAAVGQIDGNLRHAIQSDLPAVAPSYFVVDIQPDQIGPLRDRLATDPDVTRFDSAPMLRGIITAINGQPAEEAARGHWVVRGDRGVTYSADLPPGTRLTAGDWWPADYAGPPLVSFSAEEAAEIGLALGDSLTVNILGRDITATIASFREVNFENAGIGFVMAMNPAALAGAPHTHIATIYADRAAEARLLRDLASAYPNITAIPVRDAVDNAARVIDGIAAAIRTGAGATLFTGFLVLLGAASAGQRTRTYEAAVLRTLGATRARILSSFALRAALLGLAAGSVALAAGLLGGWAVQTFVMESDFHVIWPNALAIIAGGVLATLAANLAFAMGPLAARPARILRARE